MPTVTGTENLMMAAVLAEGITVISNAAREPHVYDLARCLIGMGAHITGVGTELIVIEGSGGLLHGTTHNMTADYIEAGTYMIAAAATYGDVVVEQMRPSDLRWLFSKLRSAGCDIVEGAQHVRVSCSRLRSVDITTWTAPRFRHRHATAVLRADDPGERREHHQRSLVREPLSPRCRSPADGRAASRSMGAARSSTGPRDCVGRG